MKFLCIKDFKMESGDIAFRKDTLYDFDRVDSEEYVCTTKGKEGHYMRELDLAGTFVLFTPEGAFLVLNWDGGLFRVDVKKRVGENTWLFESFDSLGKDLSDLLTGVETLNGRGVFESFQNGGIATFRKKDQIFRLEFCPGIFPEKGTLSKEQKDVLKERLKQVKDTVAVLDTFQEVYL